MLHAVLLAAVAAVGAPTLAKACAVVAVLVHAIVRRPRAAPARLVWNADGRWLVPQHATGPLEVAPGTRYTSLWVRLVLRERHRRLEIIVLSPQVEPAAWSALQARLRRNA